MIENHSSGSLYENLAGEVTRQVQSGALRPGDRLPSVRNTSRLRRLSVSTVLHAYRLLEERGVVEARPQSGYFVRLAHNRPLLPPRTPETGRVLEPQTVQVQDLARRMREDVNLAGLVQFGAALPAADLLPAGRLNGMMARLTRTCAGDSHRMGSTPGCLELRAQIARRALLAGYSPTPEEVLITNGCTEALHLALRAICSPGDLVAVESPTYFGFYQILESLGLRTLEIPCRAGEGLDLDVLEESLERHEVRAALVVTNFSNPLGTCLTVEKKRRLVGMLAGRRIPLIEDDLYGELSFLDQRPPAARAFDPEGWVVLCSSFSKVISPGLRLGWMIPGRWAARVEELKAATNGFSPLLPQLTVAAFLESRGFDHTLRRMRRAYALRTVRMMDAVLLNFPAETRVSAPEGGYVVWVQMPEGSDSLALYRRALAAGVTISPGTLFSQDLRYQNCLRLNAAVLTGETEWAVKRLGEMACELIND